MGIRFPSGGLRAIKREDGMSNRMSKTTDPELLVPIYGSIDTGYIKILLYRNLRNPSVPLCGSSFGVIGVRPR